MCLLLWRKNILLLIASMLICCTGLANESLYRKARTLQRDGKHDEAIEAFKSYLSQPVDKNAQQTALHIEALVQLMNTYQSKGEPEACIVALEEVFKASTTLQNRCLRDFYSVKGYALSRTERMQEAEETMLKALALPLHQATPERYFRDYAYAAAVFYSNPGYQKEVINWCEEAMVQAQQCENTSGKQWVAAMLGSLYKRNGQLNKTLQLFQQSKEEALARKDDLGVLNSLHTLTDIFLYFDIPEYANRYASEAIRVETGMTTKNPMVSAQTYINKGRALHLLGEMDSVPFYAEEARKLCQSLPYNSGMVDVNLLCGFFLTEKGGDAHPSGVRELQQVTLQGTAANRAKAYHQLAQTYLKHEKYDSAEVMLDSMYSLLAQSKSPAYIHLDYEPILNYYLKSRDQKNVERYVRLMLQEQQAFKDMRLNFNLVETIVGLQTEQKRQELRIIQLAQANQRLWLLSCIALAIIVIFIVSALLFRQKKQHKDQMEQADAKLSQLMQKLNESNTAKELRTNEINEYLKEKANRQELETMTPFLLPKDGETKFRQCFELLYPHFLPRLRERIPSITRREELLSMLIVLKQDNKKIAELMAIAPRSVIMLRHRFRQKIGMETAISLENFIEETLRLKDESSEIVVNPDVQENSPSTL
ncbi:MAG: hypothetical protein IKU85_02370 [Bacteroidaceae bacterium]|nr:hypothetical protein [Bacteroidaceae bacterium]